MVCEVLKVRLVDEKETVSVFSTPGVFDNTKTDAAKKNAAAKDGVNRHRPSLSTGATGFELAKLFPDRKSEKTTVRNGGTRALV